MSAADDRTPRAPAWAHARGSLRLDEPGVMAIVNITPDSFFDGGHLLPPGGDDPSVSVALRLCLAYRQQGAQLLDLGGESTRPGAQPVPPELELRRVLPVLRRLLAEPALDGVPISVDTRRATVAAAAMQAGAAIINDVTGLADPDMAAVAADTGAGLVLGHLRGEPATMMQDIRFERVLPEVAGELGRSVERALRAGVPGDRIAVDPGIGFGKTAEHSAALVAASDYLMRETGCPVVIGASRKAFLGAITGRPVQERLGASVAAAVVAALHGAAVLRVHDVGPTAEALKVAVACRRALAAAEAGAAPSGPAARWQEVERERW